MLQYLASLSGVYLYDIESSGHASTPVVCAYVCVHKLL